MSGKTWLMTGAISAALAVTAGAFGAHKLQGDVEARKLEPRMLDVFETAAKYQMYHALALVAVGLVAAQALRSNMALSIAGWAFLTGTILFSGSLYALVFSGIRWLGAITPLGGVAFILGWIALAVAAFGALGKPPTTLGD
ncbi:DUF423 domain-containing protein [soil metagenome]